MVTLTTTQAAELVDVSSRSFARWARDHGVQPLRRQRIGRSFVTVWDRAQIAAASAPTPQLLAA